MESSGGGGGDGDDGEKSIVARIETVFLAWRRFYHSKSHKYEKKRKCFSNRCKAFRRIRFYFSTKHKILSFLFLLLKFWTNAFHATKMFNCGVFLKRLTFENEIVRKIGLILAFMSAKMLRFSRTDQTNTQFHRSPRPEQLFAGIFSWTIYKQKNKFMRMWNRLYNFFHYEPHTLTHTIYAHCTALWGQHRVSGVNAQCQCHVCLTMCVHWLDANMEQTLNKRVLSHALTFYSGSYSFLAVHRVYFALVPFHFLRAFKAPREKDSQSASQVNHCQEILAQVWD